MIIILIAKLIAAEMTRIRGPKPGNKPGQKRKAVEDLSENPHTKKCRDRVQKMTNLEQKLERYKNNDRQARAVEVKKLRETQAYKDASESEKRNMEEKAKKDVMARR